MARLIEQVIMHQPRRITLSERELRVLRAMERALADEDPVLALVLRGPDADDTSRAQKAARRRQRRIVWGYPAVALSVLVLGVLAAAGVQTTGLLVLMLAAGTDRGALRRGIPRPRRPPRPHGRRRFERAQPPPVTCCHAVQDGVCQNERTAPLGVNSIFRPGL
jgi:hypothetical protein